LDKVHVFISTGRFRSNEEVRAFIDATYTDDGIGVPSAFMREVGLTECEPGCVETFHQSNQVDVAKLLAGVSYGDQWLSRVDGRRLADSAICVFAPNRLSHPQRSSLEYVGTFAYVVR
jgi:hypothetical protein